MYDTSHRICYLLYKNDVLKYFLYTFLILMIHESVNIHIIAEPLLSVLVLSIHICTLHKYIATTTHRNNVKVKDD